MRQAAIGDTVHVHHTGTLADGSETDSAAPLDITIGNGEVLSARESVFVGMAAGEAKTVTPDPVDGFGAPLRASDPNGDHLRLVVVALSADNWTADLKESS